MTLLRVLRSNIPLIILLVVTVSLRLVNLGYHDYQGDEIKAFFLPDPEQDTFAFFMDQRKGPAQFIVTLLVKQLTPDYSNRFVVRLPFALAGIFAVFLFYKLLEKFIANKQIALFASFFFATNGFLIAFSRIAQYQTFVIMFMLLALYLLYMASTNHKWAVFGMYAGLTSWACSLLSHYDGIFVAPLAFYFIYLWFKHAELSKKAKIAHFCIAGLLATALLITFYLPFLLSLTQATKDYWAGRLSGEVSSKISSSRYLFTVYQPIYVVHIYTLLSLASLVFLFVTTLFKKLPRICLNPRLFLVLAWLAIPFAFMEGLVSIPGTHIYTYLIPLFIFLGYALAYFFALIPYVRLRSLLYVPLIVAFVFIFAQVWAVYVDHTREYPYETEKFLVWEFPKPTPIFHLSMFGFPYYRNWAALGAYISQHPVAKAYSTNERKSISRYFISLPKDSDAAGYYVYISNPQSFTDKVTSEKVEYWKSKYPPVFTYEQGGRVLSSIYLMPVGKHEELLEQGY